MKLKKAVSRNIALRSNFKKKELEVKSLKVLLRLKTFNYLTLLNIYSKVVRKSRYTKINNTCIITSRANSVYRKFNLSRLKIKELAENAFLLGLKKHSW